MCANISKAPALALLGFHVCNQRHYHSREVGGAYSDEQGEGCLALTGDRYDPPPAPSMLKTWNLTTTATGTKLESHLYL